MSGNSSARLRVVVDTNVFVSSVLFRRGWPLAIRQAWYHDAFVLLLSPFQREEIEEVLSRTKLAIRYGVPEDEREALIRRLDQHAVLIAPPDTLPLSLRDPKDEGILGAALAGSADYLVTGDKDLLVLAGDPRLGPLRIVTAADFLALLTEGDPGDA